MASSIPRTFSVNTSDNNTPAEATTSSEMADQPRRSFTQMTNELTEWARDTYSHEDSFIAKEKILEAYQYPPKTLELEKLGSTNGVPNLPRCIEDLNCNIKFNYLTGLLKEGKWRYIPELNGVDLVRGTIQPNNGDILKGEFQYILALGRMEIVDGTIQFKNGDVHTGKFQYIPPLEAMHLVDGSIQYKNGDVHTGKFQYISPLEAMHLVDGGSIQYKDGKVLTGKFQYFPERKKIVTEGTMQYSNGDVHTGKFQYFPPLKAMQLVDGSIQYKNGDVHTGKFQYTPPLEAMHLVDGSIQYKNGNVLTGKFQYIHPLKAMHLVDGSIQYKDGAVYIGKFQYFPKHEKIVTEGTLQKPDGGVYTGKFQYLPESQGLRLTDGSIQYPSGKVKTGKFQGGEITEGTIQYENGDVHTGKFHNEKITEGIRHFQNGRIEEGSFSYIEKTEKRELVDGIVTKPDGKREQRTNGHYSTLLRRMSYTTKKLSSVAPPGPPAKLTLPVPKPTEQASTSTPPTQPTVSEQPKVENTAVLEPQASASGSTDQDVPTVDQPSTSTPQTAPLLVAEPNATQIQDLPEGMQTALSQLRDMPLDQLQGFLSNDLGNIVTMPQLPPDLHNSEAHRNFFKGFTGLLSEHYFMLRSISVKAIKEEAPLWVQGISMALQALSLPGTAVAGGLLNQTAQLMSQAQAEKKAREVIQQFDSDLHFTVTAHQAGVLFTQHMEHVPEITQSFLKQAKPLFKKLGEKAKLLSHNPYEDMPEVLDAYTLFLKTVKKHPEIMDAVHESNLSFQEHCETAATRLVSQGLGIAIELPTAEGSSRAGSSTHGQEVEFVEVREVPEVPNSEPAESSEVQQLKGKVAELESLMKQLLENGNAGGMAVAQTLRHMQGVGGEVYATIAESSTAAEHRLRTHSLQINELRQELFANMAPAVHRHEQDLHAIKAPDTEFTNLKDMVTASAHYLRRFGVINYANTPITVRLADGREVDLAEKLKKLHDKQPRASLKPYRPRVELQSLIAELAEEVSNLADLDLEGGKRKLGAVVAQRTRADKVYTHNTDVVKMASYYLRRFGLVNYASDEAKIQLADQEGEVSVAQALADIHHSLPNASRKPYQLQRLLEHLVMKLPDEVKDALDLELDDNAALLSRLQENMTLKRDPRLPVSLREIARQAQERQRLLGT